MLVVFNYFVAMIFPIGDTNVQGGYKPIISYSFIALNIIIFLIQISVPGNLVCEFATIPNSIVGGSGYHTLFTSMFMHGGWMHLIGNMLFLWVFADNIEAVVGNSGFLLFYLLGGLAATGLHIFFELYFGTGNLLDCCAPCQSGISCEGAKSICSGATPSLGASGAISAVLGAYIVLFPKSRIKVFFFLSTFTVPALLFLGFWFLEQLISGFGTLGSLASIGGGVAWWAHIGGFIFGLLYGFTMKGKLDIDYQE